MNLTIVLDTSVVGLLTHRRGIQQADEVKEWVDAHNLAGSRLVIPEIADYEFRRELIRLRKFQAIRRLDRLADELEYLPISTPAMRRAAALWASARQTGQPTAGDKTLDADMILVAQTVHLNDPPAIIATTNVRHLSRFTAASAWQEI